MPKSIYPTSKKSWLYSLVYPWVSKGLDLFFDGFHVKGLENIPQSGPIMLVANHQNAMIDPLICCRVVPQQLHWLTRSDVFKNPTVAKFLFGLNMLPIYREKDKVTDQSQKNEAVFEVCRTRLSKGAVISMFPEGSHRGKKQLMIPLKKGFARLAFSSIEQDPKLMDMKIVPMALDYSDFYLKHPRLIVEVGSPIAIKDFWEDYKEDNNRAINNLIKSVHSSLSTLMVDIKDDSDYEMLESLPPVFEGLKQKDSVESWRQYRDFCNRYSEVDEKEREDLSTYYHQVQAHGLSVKEVETFFKNTFSDWFFWFVELIPGLLGKALFAPLSVFTERFIKKNIQDELFYNSIRFAFFTFLSPFYTLVIWTVFMFVLPVHGLMNHLMLLAVIVSLGLFSISWARFNIKIGAVLKVKRFQRTERSNWDNLVTLRNNWRKRYE